MPVDPVIYACLGVREPPTGPVVDYDAQKEPPMPNTVPNDQRPIPADDYSKPKPSKTDEAAQESVEAEDIEEEEQADVDRLEEIDAALTEKGGTRGQDGGVTLAVSDGFPEII